MADQNKMAIDISFKLSNFSSLIRLMSMYILISLFQYQRFFFTSITKFSITIHIKIILDLEQITFSLISIYQIRFIYLNVDIIYVDIHLSMRQMEPLSKEISVSRKVQTCNDQFHGGSTCLKLDQCDDNAIYSGCL